jgi:hypothetical protein
MIYPIINTILDLLWIDGHGFIRLTTTVIQAETRKLKATWTPELSQDIEAIYGIDAVEALQAALMTELINTIDTDIIRTLIDLKQKRTLVNTKGMVYDL